MPDAANSNSQEGFGEIGVNAAITAEMSALFDRLSVFPPGTPVADLVQSLRTPARAALGHAKERCALVRWFDRDLYGFLCAGLDAPPEIERLADEPDVLRLGPGRWAIDEPERSQRLAGWQQDLVSWKDWNTRLGERLAAQPGPDDQLGAVYHLAASADPDALESSFRDWYDEADARFDLAQCHALLEMLRLQEAWRGPKLSNIWREYRQYRESRLLFADDYYKTGSYFERPDVHDHFLSVLDRDRGAPDQPWIYHLHATGGTGKTMYLRWLVSRYLVPRRIPVARVDFDDFPLHAIVEHPTDLFRRIVEQWDVQFPSNALTSLHLFLRRAEKTTAWDQSVLDTMRQQLAGTRISTPAVVILDTLEQATLSAAVWLSACVDALRTIHRDWPNLTLVLAGRYDIATRSAALRPGEFLPYELPRFSEDEAHRYLYKRGIKPGPTRDAIVERAASDEDDGAPPENAGRLTGRNPFKLAMFAELALNRASLSADDVRQFPRADIAYLLERVVRRVPSQPLRWMIRYGAVARGLTFEFAETVLLPPLIAALRGQQDDRPAKNLAEDYHDIWETDEAAAGLLDGPDGMKQLWEQLRTYARERGWLTEVTVGTSIELRFHPEVINPTRDLLRLQGIFAELQQRAVDFYERRACAAIRRWPQDRDARDDAVRALRETVFHTFQLAGQAFEPYGQAGVGEAIPPDPVAEVALATEYWQDRIGEAMPLGPMAAVAVAAEVLGKEYAEGERIPYAPVSSPGLLIRAHCRVADLLMQAAGLAFTNKVHWADFCQHLELAHRIAGSDSDLLDLIPELLATIYAAWSSLDTDVTAQTLRAARDRAGSPRESFFLELQLGQALVKLASPEAGEHLRAALDLIDAADDTGVSALDLYHLLFDHYRALGRHGDVIGIYAQAIVRAGGDASARARLLDKRASYALEIGDLTDADDRIAELRAIRESNHPSPAALCLLEARLALAQLDPTAALDATNRGLQRVQNDHERGRCHEYQGEAHGLVFDFGAAHTQWEIAAAQYDRAGDATSAARCSVLAARLTARVMENFQLADTLCRASAELRGSRDAELLTELALVRAYVAHRMGAHFEAQRIVGQALAAPDHPAHCRARVLLFGMIFDLLPAGANAVAEIEALVSQVQPGSLRLAVLDWTEYAGGRAEPRSRDVERLLSLFGQSETGQIMSIQAAVRRADLLRLFSRDGRAQEGLAGATVDNLCQAWHHTLALRRLDMRGSLVAQVQRFQDASLADTPLMSALKCLAAPEAVNYGSPMMATVWIEEAGPIWELQPPNVWQARLLEARELLASGDERLRLQSLAAEQYRNLGHTPAQDDAVTSEATVVSIATTHYLRDLGMNLDLTVDRMMGDWSGVLNQMRDILNDSRPVGPRANSTLAIEVRQELAPLPWELAGAAYRVVARAQHRPTTPRPKDQYGAVRLIRPSDRSEELNFETSSGQRLEVVYFDLGIRPEVSYADQPERLEMELPDGPPPVIVHIVAAMREGTSGIHLDFEGTITRANWFGKGAGISDLSMTAFRLGRLLNTLPERPFVILDVARPYNDAETIRMLLLRNLFATQLYEQGCARGVVACGLAEPDDRLQHAFRVVQALVSGPVRQVRDIPAPGVAYNLDDAVRLLPGPGVALWTNNPDDILFER